MEDQLTIEDFSTDELLHEISQRDIDDKQKLLKSILGLKQWHTKDDIIKEINNILF